MAHTKIFQRTNIAIADFWKKLTQNPELMYLTGGEARIDWGWVQGQGQKPGSDN